MNSQCSNKGGGGYRHLSERDFVVLVHAVRRVPAHVVPAAQVGHADDFGPGALVGAAATRALHQLALDIGVEQLWVVGVLFFIGAPGPSAQLGGLIPLSPLASPLFATPLVVFAPGLCVVGGDGFTSSLPVLPPTWVCAVPVCLPTLLPPAVGLSVLVFPPLSGLRLVLMETGECAGVESGLGCLG